MSQRELIIEGARQNNLKNINLRLPHDSVIAVTGVSGSGKSSLAFDTIFAEGQWRFIESISTYARLFLEKLDRPDVDAVHNIRPAIALEQKNPVRGARSTVGTLTELYDFLRLLFSKIAAPHCPKCNKEVRRWDTSQIVRHLLEGYEGKKALILFETSDTIEELKKRGFQRLIVNGQIVDITELSGNSALRNPGCKLDIVLDRLVLRDESRLSDSIEMAWKEGHERLGVMIADTSISLKFSSSNACDNCGIELPEPSPLLFSFNHPIGACPECKGFGNILRYDEKLIVPDEHLSLHEGAIETWEKPAYRWWKKQLIEGAKKTGIDVRKPYKDLSSEEREQILKGCPDFYGINDFFEELQSKRYKLHVRVFLSRYRNAVICPACNGKRLQKDALSYKVSGLDIAELCELPVSRLIKFFKDIDISPFRRDIAKDVIRQIDAKLTFLHRVGLDYLTLSRQGKTLSGGEYQRVNLSNQLASCLTGTLYVLDEPTVGLHARDTERISRIMSEISAMGNTIVVVEHDKEIIGNAHWVVELGPGGGHEGGDIVFTGTKEKFLKSNTLTARYVKGADKTEPETKTIRHSCIQRKELSLNNARGNNLKGVNLRIPLQKLTAVTGVSGSGKSSLIIETLYKAIAKHYGIEHDTPLPYGSIDGIQFLSGIRMIDQTPIGRSPRSNPATYLKIFDAIRKSFSGQSEAMAHGYGPGFFSFNTKGGRCERCKGEGYQKLEMYFFEDIYVACEDCNGKRYGPDALRIAYNGKSIYDVLNITVDEAARLFSDVPQIIGKLSFMKDVGLGYLRLGQSATTLSGGEAQRLKICSELSSGKSRGLLYILDEPTVGLHHRDVRMLIGVLRRLVDAGNTVVVIEHNLDVISASDRIIDLGPEGGDRGGRIIFEGTSQDIVKQDNSYTGRYLKSMSPDYY